MKLIESSIRYPVSTTVGVVLLVLFGAISLFQIPIQLVPNVEEPKVTATTVWPGASPQEIEREIINEQEEQLKSLEGLKKLESESRDSVGTITLTFQVGTPLDAAVVRVANRLEQVPEYPEDVEKPVIRTVDIGASAIAWIVLEPSGPDGFQGDISTLYDFADDFIKPAFERVPGVAAANIFGGRERELHVIVDPAKLAARQVTLSQMGAALDRENRNYSGGDFDEGKRRYVVRTIGEYTSPADIENIIIAHRNGVPVYVRDVARVELTYRKPDGKVFQKGVQVLALNALKEPNANVLEVMDGLRKSIDDLNRDLLAPRGLKLTQVYDETDYIYSAIGLVEDNLYVGSALAILCLLLFLRTWSATLVIATAIPISIVGAFLFLFWFDRTLNVISLAGMAFAAGQVVDNSTVVLENIYRHRQMGKSRFAATLDGTEEVWGAVLITTVTTVAVFLPIVYVKEEAGQLFADIAIAISAAIGLSLLVSITVVPSMSAKIITAAEGREGEMGHHNLWGLVPLAARFTRWVGDTVYWINGSTLRRIGVVIGMTAGAVALSFALLPRAEYLPTGNTNFAFGVMLPPPGYNVDEVAELRKPIEDVLRPMWEVKLGTPEAQKMPGGGVDSYFYVALPGTSFMGVRSNEPLRLRELLPPVQQAITKVPGSIGFITQASLFQRGLGQGRNIDIEITGPELPVLIQHGGRVFGEVMRRMPGAQARPIPSLDLLNPEVQVITNRKRAAELGISNRELGFAVNALVDGAKVSEYRVEGREIDLMLRGEDRYASQTHAIEMIPISTADGRLVTLGSVGEVVVANGPTQINHRERQRVITIQVQPPEEMPLEEAMLLVQNQIIEPMKQDGSLSGPYRAVLSGTADKLVETFNAFKWNFLLAVVITYLLMAALFESFLHPLVIMFSVPLGAVGGLIGLKAMNAFLSYQPMDILTMLGFIILVGTVTNNATLIVHQSLNHMRDEGLAPREAIREATMNRMRPMFMTTGTNVFGTLPLVLFPGAGSELYRGLGAVFTGGLIISTLFTLFLIPALFSLALDLQTAVLRRVYALLGRTPAVAEPSKPSETEAD
jgi:HAE1 family hydrophobic/amphiphilic exporter-1